MKSLLDKTWIIPEKQEPQKKIKAQIEAIIKKRWPQYEVLNEDRQNNLLNAVFNIIKVRYPEKSVDEKAINDFLHPILSEAIPTTELINANKLVKLVLNAKKIGLFIDYDVDGLTAGAIWHTFLSYANKEYVKYCPGRSEGYGPSKQAIEDFIKNKCDVILLLDCGTSASYILDFMLNEKIEIGILDHHAPTNVTEIISGNNITIVNPYVNQQVEYQNICTAGLSFLMASIFDKFMLNSQNYMSNLTETDLLDFACLGTIADCMPLHGYNRALVAYGLAKINGHEYPEKTGKIIFRKSDNGIKQLLYLLNKKYNVDTSTIGYYLAPCLNAAGRLDKSEIAFDLLVSRVNAKENATALINYNNQRRLTESDMIKSAEDQAREVTDEIIVVAHEKWHPGIVGIIAGKLKDAYNKTTFAFCKKGKDKLWHGSGRANDNIKLNELIADGREQKVIESGGGHAAAAGLTVTDDKFLAFKEWISKYRPKIDEVQNRSIKNQIIVDYNMSLEEYDLEMKKNDSNLDILAPFGNGHEDLKIMITGLVVKNINNLDKCIQYTFLNTTTSGNITFNVFRNLSKWRSILDQNKLTVGNQVDVVFNYTSRSIEDIRKHNAS